MNEEENKKTENDAAMGDVLRFLKKLICFFGLNLLNWKMLVCFFGLIILFKPIFKVEVFLFTPIFLLVSYACFSKKKPTSKLLKYMGVLAFASVLYIIYYMDLCSSVHTGPGNLGIIFFTPPFLLSLLILFIFGILLFRYLEFNLLVWVYILMWAVVLFGDHWIARAYFDHLCATKAGGHIYKTIDLPEMPVWEGKGLVGTDSKFNLQYNWDIQWDIHKLLPGISSTHITLYQKDNLLSENQIYKFSGGWFIHALAMGSPGKSGECGPIKVNIFNALTIQGKNYDDAKNLNKGEKQS